MHNLAPTITATLLCLCPVAAQWSARVSAGAVNTSASEAYPALTLDGLTMYFASSRSGVFDLFRATRPGPFTAFGPGTAVTELNSAALDSGPALRADELEIFFFSDRPGGMGGVDLWHATRASTALPFGTPTPVVELNSSLEDATPTITEDGLRIYFSSTRSGGGSGNGFNIWTASRPDWSSPFGTPTPVLELDTGPNIRDPWISPDGLVIFVSSLRFGGAGSYDLYYGTRASPGDAFRGLTFISDLSGSNTDGTPAFARFHDELFFSSFTGATYHIYMSRLPGAFGCGFGTANSPRTLRFSDPTTPGGLYIAASAFGRMPGINYRFGTILLNPDPLFVLTIGGLPPVLTGYVGVLDANGLASGGMDFSALPELSGLHFYTAFLVLDASYPDGIKNSSQTVETLVQ